MNLRHTFKSAQFLDFLSHHLAIALAERHFHAVGEFATVNTSHSDTTYIRIIVKRSDEHLWLAFHDFWARDMLDDSVEHSVDIISRFVPIEAHPPLLSRAKHGWEVELVFSSVEVAHQFENGFLHLIWAAVWLIHLIDNHDRLQTNFNRFLKHEASLRHWTFKSINEQQTAVGHVEHTLHFTTEIGVSRGIYNVDFVTVVVD